MNPFISLWLGPQYILNDTVLGLLLFKFFIGQIRGATDQFLFGYGLFYDTWAPIAEGVIYLIVAIIGGYLWGLPGILLGGCISLLIIICGWKPYFLFRSGFKLPQKKYWLNIIKYVLIAIFTMVGMAYYIPKIFTIVNPYAGALDWLIYALFLTISFSLVYLLIMYVLTQGMRNALARTYMKK